MLHMNKVITNLYIFGLIIKEKGILTTIFELWRERICQELTL